MADWEECYTDNGHLYFYNPVTMVSLLGSSGCVCYFVAYGKKRLRTNLFLRLILDLCIGVSLGAS